MGKQKTKGKEGELVQYITKGKAMRKLQLNTKQFHRLCILKGVYPRDPRKKKDSSKTYYHTKDVKYLAHEQLLSKFREIDSWVKKIRKATVKKDGMKAEKLKENAPSYSLHHLLRERYPRFGDALRDLDDALSMVCLFASCPSNKDYKISFDMIRMSERLWHEFELYLIVSKSVRKSFLSIKGIYYQAEIKGQEVTWLVPYQFAQHLPTDVDYSIMLTFLEFYHTLLRFVNFKLFQEVGLSYPPDLSVPTSQHISQAQVPEDNFHFDPEFQSDPDVKKIQKMHEDREASKKLFKGFVFFLGRETPRYSLELIIRSCAGEIAPDDCDQVTHQIVDRPINETRQDREYVLPQWVYDCLNFKILLPIAPYKPGCQAPPHLSPFVDYQQESHIPDRLKEIMQLKGENIELQQEEESQKKELGKIMMTKKIRNLYTRMQFSLKRKRARVERLARGMEKMEVEESNPN
ncbi:unnamed protein product [Blepharisma stoltei]|uniref:Pescadillo homolog n=1 Tax=Blepharisma stoltei TaxID=1481888 RepID=A0AAU9IJU0_9CILI|nr:unnamed protein product [Blepharisma stoltei]